MGHVSRIIKKLWEKIFFVSFLSAICLKKRGGEARQRQRFRGNSTVGLLRLFKGGGDSGSKLHIPSE